ncbi:MAG: response regulator [Desulfovibrionales bacterium]|nr:MAG: response regulator [Desulfovibrionales bacterium]
MSEKKAPVVLIVEKDAAFRATLAGHLRTQGFNLLVTELTDDMGLLLQQRKVAVVLLGLAGLKQQGISFLRLVLEVSPASKVVLLNNLEHLSLSIEAMKLGAVDEVSIPVDMELLVEKVRLAVG